MQTMRIEGKWYRVKPMTQEECRESICNVCGGTGSIPDEPKPVTHQIGEMSYNTFSTTARECPNPFCKGKYVLKI